MKDDRKNHSNKMKEIEGKDPRQSGEREKEKIPTHIYIWQERKKTPYTYMYVGRKEKVDDA